MCDPNEMNVELSREEAKKQVLPVSPKPIQLSCHGQGEGEDDFTAHLISEDIFYKEKGLLQYTSLFTLSSSTTP